MKTKKYELRLPIPSALSLLFRDTMVMVPAHGMRLLELSCLQEALSPLLGCSCGAGQLQLREDAARADGLFCALVLVCAACSYTLPLPTSRPLKGRGCGWQVNECSKLVHSQLGLTHNTLRTLFSLYCVPFAESAGIVSQKDNKPTDNQEQQTFVSEHPCPHCTNTFTTESECQRHVKKKHDVCRHQCSTCGKTFKKTFNLSQHLRTHTGEKPFLCSTCGKAFGDASTLSKHQRALHRAERPLSCTTCGKKFYHAGHLRVHLRRHTGEKPYVCSQCGKCFAYSDSMKKHMASHDEKQRFVCVTCGRAFRWRESLKQHMNTHRGQAQQMPALPTTEKSIQQTPPVTDSLNTQSGIDVVSLTQVIPYLETIRVEYY